MKKTTAKRGTRQLTPAELRQLQKDRALIGRELPELIAKHQRIYEASLEPTLSGALRQAIHKSKLLLPDMVRQSGVSLDDIDDFLTGEKELTTLQVDRLTAVLGLTLRKAAKESSKPRTAKAG